MASKPKLSTRPGKKLKNNNTFEDFVNGSSTPDVQNVHVKEPTKRLTIDLPKSLHTRLKLQSVVDGTKMNVVLRKLIEGYLDKVEAS